MRQDAEDDEEGEETAMYIGAGGSIDAKTDEGLSSSAELGESSDPLLDFSGRMSMMNFGVRTENIAFMDPSSLSRDWEDGSASFGDWAE